MEERIQKILAAAGLGSRRKCEELILQGRVSVDGKLVSELGAKADLDSQNLCCDGEPVSPQKKCWYLFYKPRGVICTNSTQEGAKVADYFKGIAARLFTIGRLDKDSEGLILVTNDGKLAQCQSHPSYEVAKVYHATVDDHVKPEILETLRAGVWLEEGKVVPEKVELLKAGRTSSRLEIVLKEGKNREIRRLLGRVGLRISRLVRVQFGVFNIGKLKPGQFAPIPSECIEKLEAEAHHKPRRRRSSFRSRRS
jgi:23S rRNA pseudouridine2605 synthase